MTDAPILQAHGLTKRFGAIEALTDVDIEVLPGEIHALAGENGAGKSTLLKAFAGLHTPTSGEMLLKGEPFAPQSVGDARAAGIGIVFQETTLQPRFTVAENLVGSAYRRWSRGPVISWRCVREEAARRLEAAGIDIPLDVAAEDLPLGEQRLVELAAAVATRPAVLLIDEITASLDATEVKAFFDVARRVARQGTAVVYVSHHLEETFELCDRVTVLRDGRLVGCRAVAELDEAKLGSMMVGREITNRDIGGQLTARAEGPPALELRGVTVGDEIHDVDLSVRPGEIVGLAGLQGAGPESVLSTLFGMRQPDAGTMRLFGEEFAPTGPRDAIRAGVALVPKERDLDGAVGMFTARRNVTLPIVERLARAGFLVGGSERGIAQPAIESVGVRPARDDIPCESLSGGNRQKVVIAKWLATKPRVLLLNNPTRGVDVGAKDEIYVLLADLAAEGIALLVASEELPELIGLCNRVVVMRRGRVAKTFGVGEERTEDALVEQML